MKTICLSLLGAAALALGPAPAQAQPKEQVVAVFYRVGTTVMRGMLDYLRMLNARDGGINGVKLAWVQCDTGYENARSVECYEGLKKQGPDGVTLVHPLSSGISHTLIERASADRIPLVSVGHGRAAAADGRVFPYVFPLIATYWDQAAAMVRYIGEEEGGLERLRSKKIALLHQDSAFGREPIPVLGELAKKYGYRLATIAVAPPGVDQHAQWTQIRELRPDWVILWGSGPMNPTALQTAAKIGYPRGRMLGVWWSGAEQDMLPAGMAAKDFMAAEFAVTGRAYPVIAEIERHVYGKGDGRMDDSAAMGSLSYNRGVVFGILTAEAVRVAQNRFGTGRPVTGRQLQWALEHLRLNERRLKQLGAAGFMPAIDTSCADHAGAGGVRFVRWDGSRWYAVTGWVEALHGDRELLRAQYAESAMRYARENNIKPRKCPAA